MLGLIAPHPGPGSRDIYRSAKLLIARHGAKEAWRLAEISARVTPGRHTALLVDQAGWHLSKRLVVPANITIVPLPAKCPELNPQENTWQFMRDNWLSNRVFTSYTDIVYHCCYALNNLAEQSWIVMSIRLRNWAQEF